ncbi:DUF4226 domain-containing protein [Mycobacterium heckeshornense]|nr:DUF4226 domain-containing protein [Mycobacterium heckeshornense]KMV21405.1 hypothetical protein ACT16_16825 [Mycobacterium heckeshornense]MCV7034355.1 DUF4226 domain-containing protein [Mycobacterium heckeshornense]PIJ30589.1 DUF4226 domain-containing protein [Mycobacterium heckeshornense]
MPAAEVAMPSDRQRGAAADAIRDAEIALAQQNSACAQLDMQVVSAILNAHQKTLEGSDALAALQRDVEAAVRSRTDLDTPAGARDFQRFLTGKLREIRAVVTGTGLDDTSKSALMAAWTSLYRVSTAEPQRARGGQQPARSTTANAGPQATSNPAESDNGADPYLDALLADDPGLFAEDPTAPVPQAPVPPMPPMTGFPALGGMPGGGMLPTGLPGLGMPGGIPLGGQLPDTGKQRAPDDLEEALPAPDAATPQQQPAAEDVDETGNDKVAEPASAPEQPAAGPTTVTLPTGETVTAASPQLAAAIGAAAAGTPIADAFRQQGITIPPPGTAVDDPVDPSRVAPGDIGMFTDRHALALGNSKALLNGQIQHISSVTGPSFLGWEHPPVPSTANAPAKPETPAPTRPAATTGTSP